MYWLTGFPLIKQLGAHQEIITGKLFKKETNKYKEKFVIEKLHFVIVIEKLHLICPCFRYE